MRRCFVLYAMMILLACWSPSLAQQTSSAPTGEAASLRQRIQQLEREMAQLQSRHGQLRRAVQDALPALRDRLRTPGSVDKVTRSLERALRGEDIDTGTTRTAAASPPAEVAPPKDKLDLDPPPIVLPNTSPPPAAGSRHAGLGFYFQDISFVPSVEGGYECVGEMVNKASEQPITPRFAITIRDAQGQDVTMTYFYLAFSQIEQSKIFRAAIAEKPPENGSFTITASIPPPLDRGDRNPDEMP